MSKRTVAQTTKTPMNARTLAALQGSIAKWEAIVYDGGIDEGISNCPLCCLFIEDDCIGCPVRAAAGPWCTNTPTAAEQREIDDRAVELASRKFDRTDKESLRQEWIEDHWQEYVAAAIDELGWL